MRINFAKLSRKDIQAIMTTAGHRLKELEEETVGTFVEDIRKRAERAGIAIDEIAARLVGNKAATQSRSSIAPRSRAKSDGRRSVAPKYHDPKTGNSWSGRGFKPRWLQAALKDGRKLEDFAVGTSTGRSPRKGRKLGKVAAKYKHPKTGESWSGRGSQPKWLRAEIAAGKKLQAFAV